MNLTLAVIGLVFVAAAVIGGGLKAAGIEVPPIVSPRRQALLAAVGVLALAVAWFIGEDASASPTTAPHPAPPTVPSRSPSPCRFPHNDPGPCSTHGCPTTVSVPWVTGPVRAA